MKLLVTIFILLSAFSLQAKQLLLFDHENYAGWTYNHDDKYPLNPSNITRKNISVFQDFTLTSPPFTPADTLRSVQVQVTYWTTTWRQPTYNLTNSSPTLELIDLQGNVVASQYVLLTEAAQYHDLDVTLTVPSDISQVKFRIAAWNANADCPGAITKVVVSDGSPEVLAGDANNDGVIDASDITLVINVILGTATIEIERGDINQDGVIDSSDVSMLILMTLGN